jgi:hypothetical protein
VAATTHSGIVEMLRTFMSKAELFTDATKRNALRRASGLPLLNIRDEIEKEQNALNWKDFADACQQHKAVRDQIAVRIKADLAAKGFACLSHGGQILLATKVTKEFHEFLRGIGVKIPTVKGTRYGSIS